MDQLILLWNLQERDDELNQLTKRLKDVERGENVKALELKLQKSELALTNNKTQIDVDNGKIRKHSKMIDEFNFKIKEFEEKLYSGDITDLNQIQHMNKEINSFKQLVEELESETLSLMENVESLKNKLLELENVHSKCKNELDLALDLTSRRIKELTDKIKEKEELRTKSLEHIDKELLKKYQSLKTRRGRAIAKITDDKCTGCHMNIPLTIVSKLKRNDSINYCDNCDRILFYMKE